MSELNARPHTVKLPSKRSLAQSVALSLLALAVLTLDWQVAGLRERTRGDDFFQYWAAGKAILRGGDPYDPQTWRQIYEQEGRWRWQTDQPAFLYPLWTAFVFVPLAALPVVLAALVWAILSQLLVVLSASLMIRGLQWSRYSDWLPLTIGVLVAFEPVSLTVLFGQLGILLLTLLCAVFYLLSRDHYTMAGVLLSLTLIKPQVVLLVIPALFLLAFRQRRWALLGAFAVTTLTLAIASWALAPEWPSRWQGNLLKTASVRLAISPTIWGFSHTVAASLQSQHLWALMGLRACLLVLVLGIVGYLWYAARRISSTGSLLAILLSSTVIASVLTTPYVLSYDFAVLVLPVLTCLWLIHPLPSLARRSLLGALIACSVLLPWALLAVSAQTGNDTTSMLFPASLLALLLAVYVSRRRWEERAMAADGQERLLVGWKHMEI